MQSPGSITTLLVLVTALAIGLSACHIQEPQKPASVPREAFWVGGPDGGVFVTIRAPAGQPIGLYQGKIFHANGEIWYDGPLVLEPKDRAPVDPADHKQFTGWDGEALLLRDGGALRAGSGR